MLDSSALHENIFSLGGLGIWSTFCHPKMCPTSRKKTRSKSVDTSVAWLPKNIQASDLFHKYQEL